MSDQIKPCPFCGNVGLDFTEGSTFRWMLASCSECGATCGEERVQTSGNGYREDWWQEAKIRATKTWNTRATQPQAPQGGAITDAERYEFICTIKDEVTMDFLAECIGSRKHLDTFVDELIKERKSTAPTETPEVQK
jgi:restriction alleviation protein Lar